nr:hypothetical protein GCM10020063_005650 [Dactylosporangium thailandense]
MSINVPPGATTGVEVRIETVDIDGTGDRQIGSRRRMSELLSERSADIQRAITEAARVVQGAGSALPERDGWQVESVEAKFGIKLAAETGVILSKVTTEASLEVKITVKRAPAAEV